MLLPKNNSDQKNKNDVSSMVQKQMVYFFPFLTVLILFKLPSALGLYWLVSGIFSIVQQYIIFKKEN